MLFNYGNLQTQGCPSPEVLIEIANPSNPSKSFEVIAIIETGAVITCIPEFIIEELGNLIYSTVSLRSLNNSISVVKTYYVNIKIADINEVIEVLSVPKKYALIGRDILNRYKVVLDAPNNQWSIEES